MELQFWESYGQIPIRKRLGVISATLREEIVVTVKRQSTENEPSKPTQRICAGFDTFIFAN
jgi:hypothetical protein